MSSVTGCLNAGWKIKLLIQSSETWQTLVSPASSQDRTILYAADEKAIPFPRCIINDSSEGGRVGFRKVSLSNWARDGEITATFEIEVPATEQAESYEARCNWMVSQVGAIIQDVMELTTPPLRLVGQEYPVNLMAIESIVGPAVLLWEERDMYDLLPQDPVAQLPLCVQTIQFTLGP